MNDETKRQVGESIMRLQMQQLANGLKSLGIAQEKIDVALTEAVATRNSDPLTTLGPRTKDC